MADGVPIPLSHRKIIVVDETSLESVDVQEIDDGRIVWVPVNIVGNDVKELGEWALDGVVPVRLDSLSWETDSSDIWMDEELELEGNVFSGAENEKEYKHQCDHDDPQVDRDSEVVPFGGDTEEVSDHIWNQYELWTSKVEAESDGEGWNEGDDESDT